MRIRSAQSVASSLLVTVILLFGGRLQSFGVLTTTVYNSFGPGNTYNSGIVWAVGGATSPSGYRGQAEFFVPGISGNLTAIQLATAQLSGSKLSNFFIAQDNGSGVPGTILESYLNVQNANGLLTINSTTQPLLLAGQKYWFCDEPAADNSYNGWYENSQSVTNGFGFERSQWGWQFVGTFAPASGVFSVLVTAVPEPSVAALAMLGVVVFARRIRRATA